MSDNDLHTQLALLRKDISYVRSDIKDIKDDLQKNYVSQQEFKPVKAIVFSMVAIILAFFLNMVLRGGQG